MIGQVLQIAAFVLAAAITLCVAWAALFTLGPLACLVVLVLEAADREVPADAPLLFAGTAAAWAIALAVTVTWRVLRPLPAFVTDRRAAPRSRRPRTQRATQPRGAAGPPGAEGAAASHEFLRWATRAVADPFFTAAAGRAASETRERAATRGPSSTSRTAGHDSRGARAARDGSGSRSGASRRDPPRSPPPPRAVPPPPPPRRAEPRPPDPHVVLGISRGASAEQIRTAYRALIKKYHPDRVGDLPSEFRDIALKKTREIREAYEALKGRA